MVNSLKTTDEFPPSVSINSLNSDLSRSHIIHGKTKNHFADWAGHLSLKTFKNGKAYYDAGGGHYGVGDNEYLVLNESQRYKITIDSETDVESFCIFFESGFAAEVNRCLRADPVQLLDDPEKPNSKPLNFVQKLYRSESLESLLFEVRNSIEQRSTDHVWLKEKLHLIMERLLEMRENTFHEIQQVPALRASTREELYKRIFRVRDFIAASYDQPITIAEMANVACLSPNHFLRSFKQIFRITPHKYLTNLRLGKAKYLLEHTDLSVITICHSVGFESQSSFSLLFRRNFGNSPYWHRRKR